MPVLNELLPGHHRTSGICGPGLPMGSIGADPGSLTLSRHPGKKQDNGGYQGRPSPRHRAAPWGWEEAGLGVGLKDGPSLTGSMARQGRPQATAGLVEDPRGEHQGQSGLAVHKTD